MILIADEKCENDAEGWGYVKKGNRGRGEGRGEREGFKVMPVDEDKKFCVVTYRGIVIPMFFC